MQTWLVHMRRPRRLVRDLTPAGAIAFQLFLACNVLAALIHPLFMATLSYLLFAATPLRGAMGDAAPVFAATFFCGYASTIVLDLVGLWRRGLLAHGWVLILTPVHWFLLSLAAWRALAQILYDPQRWEKTEHGLAKNSRSAASKRRTLIAAARGVRHAPTAIAPVRIKDPMQVPPVRLAPPRDPMAQEPRF
jgi:hypothetical protein